MCRVCLLKIYSCLLTPYCMSYTGKGLSRSGKCKFCLFSASGLASRFPLPSDEDVVALLVVCDSLVQKKISIRFNFYKFQKLH